MPAFVNQLATVTLHAPSWENYEVVVIKEKMGLADEEWVSNQYAKMGANKKGAPEFQASLGSIKRKTLERMIISWTFAENGVPVELNSANIERLTKDYADYIYEQINERNQPMDEVQQNDFLNSANPATSETIVTS